MATDKLHIYKSPKLEKPRLLLGFTGWMDSGEVSTGTIRSFAEKLDAESIAEIETKGFYIQNFPGPMDLASLFRPYTRIKDGMVTYLEEHSNLFFCDEINNLILFVGREPNLNWEDFADCIFSLCEQFGVQLIYFIGSVAGLVPHTREPRLFCSVSDKILKHEFENYTIGFSNYNGPASIVTYLTANAPKHNIHMASLVATVPAYVQGNNPILPFTRSTHRTRRFAADQRRV
jgi:proteasome assembly chaperone (PAC2) family protein